MLHKIPLIFSEVHIQGTKGVNYWTKIIKLPSYQALYEAQYIISRTSNDTNRSTGNWIIGANISGKFSGLRDVGVSCQYINSAQQHTHHKLFYSLQFLP